MVNIGKLAPGVSEPSPESLSLAKRMHAVPQIDDIRITLDDGQRLQCSRYQYERLDTIGQIRLVCLRPGEATMRLQDGRTAFVCELVTVMLQDAPDYVALSYAWGDLNSIFPVLISNGDAKQIVTVTQSLITALLRQVHETTTQYFWADQLCINQYDVIEKAQQVNLMRQIFAQASNTLVWLGTAQESMDPAFGLIQELAQKHPESNDILAELDRMTDLRAIKRDFHFAHWPEQRLHMALDELILFPRRQWFTRLWTFQEVLVSRAVQIGCGKHNLDLRSLVLAFVVAATLLSKFTPGVINLRQLLFLQKRFQKGERDHLLEILMDVSTLRYECWQPLDRIYALLGLQSKENQCEVRVDYEKSLRDLYTDVAREVIRTTKTLRLLQQARSSQLSERPSWVPQWHAESTAWYLDYTATEYNCCSSRPHMLEPSPAPEELLVRGRLVATITSVSSHRFADYEDEFNHNDLKTALGQTTLLPDFAAPQHRAFLGLHPNVRLPGEERYIRQAIARALTCGKSNYRPIARPAVPDQWEDFSDLVDHLTEQQPDSVSSCRGRRLAAMDHYALGLVPDSAQQGDVVSVVHGCSTPVVLRRHRELSKEGDTVSIRKPEDGKSEVQDERDSDNDGTRYEFVGVCYVRGIMSGEAVNWKVEEAERIVLV